jgi:NAD(P)-dependent dehydrogenase (short-subunit alcohol dehydrogenase family)
VVVNQLDLASLASVRQLASDILENEPRLDILINNAGCVTVEKKLTDDGLEYQMQANYFGHFLLTNLLLGMLFERYPNSLICCFNPNHFRTVEKISSVPDHQRHICRSFLYQDF